MKTREELTEQFKNYKGECHQFADFPTAIMEVLLDIRDLLIKMENKK